MNRYLLLLLTLIGLSACSGQEDPLNDVLDISVPERLTGCVARDDDGSCVKAVCVADDDIDCDAWAKACAKHGHVVDERDGHDTCEREEPES